MTESNRTIEPPLEKIWIAGSGPLACSIAICVAGPGTEVVLFSDQEKKDSDWIEVHFEEMVQWEIDLPIGSISVVNPEQESPVDCDLVIITGVYEKKRLQSIIGDLESNTSGQTAIAVTTNHIPLSDLQFNSRYPKNILVMNWAEPAHTTSFLELVGNTVTDPSWVDRLYQVGLDHWGKNPFVVRDEIGVRGRMQAAMIREAFFLVEEGYAGIEDIDRACRNDPGTYLPFAGHFQYMDLMGTYAYGVVMEKLNKELSNATELPSFFNEIIEAKKMGMEDGQGLYAYSEEESDDWENKMRKYSFEISELMSEYPFGYLEEEEKEVEKIRLK